MLRTMHRISFRLLCRHDLPRRIVFRRQPSFNYIARNSRSASGDAFALLVFSLGNEITAFCCELCAETLFSIDLTALLFADRTAPSGSISPAPITAVLPTAFPKRLPHTNANIMIIGRATSTSFLFSEFYPYVFFVCSFDLHSLSGHNLFFRKSYAVCCSRIRRITKGLGRYGNITQLRI